MLTRRALLQGAAAAAGTLLAGCASPGVPAPAATALPEPSATPLPTPTEPAPPTATAAPPATATVEPLPTPSVRIVNPALQLPPWWYADKGANPTPPLISRTYRMVDMLELVIQPSYSWCHDCDPSTPAETRRDAFAYALYQNPGRQRGDPTARGRALRWEQLIDKVLHPYLESTSADTQYFPDDSIAVMELTTYLHPSLMPATQEPCGALEATAHTIFRSYTPLYQACDPETATYRELSEMPDGTLMRLGISAQGYASVTTVSPADVTHGSYKEAFLEY
ncbi:MAG: hypothetical protein HYY37_04780 [Candidatus Aenigmarchaeota archaeon]|nr:hypothetical protein [Candidatus Aenigmarchaeota archaeon]